MKLRFALLFAILVGSGFCSDLMRSSGALFIPYGKATLSNRTVQRTIPQSLTINFDVSNLYEIKRNTTGTLRSVLGDLNRYRTLSAENFQASGESCYSSSEHFLRSDWEHANKTFFEAVTKVERQLARLEKQIKDDIVIPFDENKVTQRGFLRDTMMYSVPLASLATMWGGPPLGAFVMVGTIGILAIGESLQQEIELCEEQPEFERFINEAPMVFHQIHTLAGQLRDHSDYLTDLERSLNESTSFLIQGKIPHGLIDSRNVSDLLNAIEEDFKNETYYSAITAEDFYHDVNINKISFSNMTMKMDLLIPITTEEESMKVYEVFTYPFYFGGKLYQYQNAERFLLVNQLGETVHMNDLQSCTSDNNVMVCKATEEQYSDSCASGLYKHKINLCEPVLISMNNTITMKQLSDSLFLVSSNEGMTVEEFGIDGTKKQFDEKCQICLVRKKAGSEVRVANNVYEDFLYPKHGSNYNVITTVENLW